MQAHLRMVFKPRPEQMTHYWPIGQASLLICISWHLPIITSHSVRWMTLPRAFHQCWVWFQTCLTLNNTFPARRVSEAQKPPAWSGAFVPMTFFGISWHCVLPYDSRGDQFVCVSTGIHLFMKHMVTSWNCLQTFPNPSVRKNTPLPRSQVWHVVCLFIVSFIDSFTIVYLRSTFKTLRGTAPQCPQDKSSLQELESTTWQKSHWPGPFHCRSYCLSLEVRGLRPRVQGQCLLWLLSLACRLCSPVSSHHLFSVCLCLQVSLFYKDPGHVGLGLP